MKNKGHHTCSKNNGETYVLENAPFISKFSDFLSEGYYFWDDNIEMAKVWGYNHYKNDYFIIECELDINENKCFDLVGNRKHQIFLTNFINKYNKSGNITNLSYLINILRKLNKEKNNNIFPFESVRAIDYIPPIEYKIKKIKFRNDLKQYTILNPKIAICFFSKNSLPLQNIKIIFKS